MTVVLITGNLINQFKCLIATALFSAEHKGSRFDVDEIQKDMGAWKPNGEPFSVETRGVGTALGEVLGPQQPEDHGLPQAWSHLRDARNQGLPGP